MFWNESRIEERGLPDLLLASALVDDGVLLQRDGSLLAAWSYSGPDFISCTDDEVWRHSERLNEGLRLGSGWMIQVDVIRSEIRNYLPQGEFADSVTRLIDDERRQQFLAAGARYQSEYFITLTFCPPDSREEKLTSFFFDGRAKSGIADAALRKFQVGIESFEGVFGSLLRMRRLKSQGEYDDLLRYIRRDITGVDHPFILPEFPVYLNDLLGVDVVHGNEPLVDGRHIRVIAIEGFPPMSRPGVLREVDRLPMEYRWHTRAMPIDAHEAQQIWAKTEEAWDGVSNRGLDVVRKVKQKRANAGAKEMENDAYNAQLEAFRGRVQYANYTSVLIVRDDNAGVVDEKARWIQSTLRNLGFGARIETINATESLLGSIPGDGYANVRRQRLHTLNLAHLLPVSSVWQGSQRNPSPLFPPRSPALMMAVTNGSTPYYFNAHVEDVGHTLIVGPPGSGKSFFNSILAAQSARYAGAQVFAFDRGYSFWPLTMAAGGEFYDLAGPHAELCFSPLRHISTDADLAWACDWIGGLCELNGLSFAPSHRNAVAAAMGQLRQGRCRTLTDFCSNVQDMEIREALRHYTIDGPLGSLLDAESDSLGHGKWIAFETEHLLNLDAKAVIPVLLYLFRRIEMRLDGSPTLILLDEAWSYLEHPLFRRKLREWLKVARKANASVVMATQQISDIANADIADVVLENCPTKVLLPNAEAMNPGCREFYQRVGLNDRELEVVASSIPKKHYYIVQRGNRRLVDLAAGPVATSFCGVNGQDERRAMQDLMTAAPENWRAEWLVRKGLPDWAARLNEFESEMRGAICASA